MKEKAQQHGKGRADEELSNSLMGITVFRIHMNCIPFPLGNCLECIP